LLTAQSAHGLSKTDRKVSNVVDDEQVVTFGLVKAGTTSRYLLEGGRARMRTAKQ
jgi:hypothetical protein